MTPEQQYCELFQQLIQLCNENDWGDPFSYARGKEIYTANRLKHLVAKTYAGADATDEVGECEYKSTTQARIQGTYNGISVQPTWEEQVDYLKNQKIAKYRNHYFARFDLSVGDIVEAYRIDGNLVLDILLPKLEKKYHSTRHSKDPRLGATITMTEIKRHGEPLELYW